MSLFDKETYKVQPRKLPTFTSGTAISQKHYMVNSGFQKSDSGVECQGVESIESYRQSESVNHRFSDFIGFSVFCSFSFFL